MGRGAEQLFGEGYKGFIIALAATDALAGSERLARRSRQSEGSFASCLVVAVSAHALAGFDGLGCAKPPTGSASRVAGGSEPFAALSEPFTQPAARVREYFVSPVSCSYSLRGSVSYLRL